MPRTDFEDVDALLDPLLMYNWDLVIPQVPGVQGHNAKNFKSRIMTTSLPGRIIESVVQDLKGVTRETAGRVQYTRSLPFELMETRDLIARDTLAGWSRYARNDSGLGTYYSEYSTMVNLLLFDDHDQVIRNIALHRCWIEMFDDSPLDGSASAAVNLNGVLKYFRWTETNQ